ncbi:MAG: 50S ribosomal protein L27 [uncultured bacterium]|nr:MAG: 50S ribosomal protein L27 [uncultured bacterium]
MSTHKAAGKAKQHTSPAGKRLGTKVGGMEKINSGQILVRQNGTKIGAGKNVKVGRDHTLYAVKSGIVSFTTRLGKKLANIIEK